MKLSNAKYFIKSTISSTATVGGTFLLSTDTELGANLETGTDKVSLVLKNGTQIERMEVTATGGTATIVLRGLTQASTSTPSVGLQKQWQDGTLAYIADLAFDGVDKQGDTMQGLLGVITYADLAALQAAYPVAPNGTSAYATAEGEFYDGVGGSWQPRASGTNPNASLTVAGKVEIATQTEIDNVTDIGATGAYAVVIPSTLDAKVMKQSSLVNSGITGEIKIWTTAVAPTNWLICDGASLLRAGTYANLFAVIGTTYGSVDGTHFTLPNLKGKVIVGYNASETEFDTLGETGGEKTHTLTTAEIPAHTHPLQYGTNTSGGYIPLTSGAFVSDTSKSTLANTGGDGAHNNLQPYIALNYIIRY